MIRGNRELDVLVVAATPLELAGIVEVCETPSACRGGAWAWQEGKLAALSAGLLCTGVGKVNMAMALSHVLLRVRPHLLVALGVGGAFSKSGLEPGDVAVASGEVYGDEGAMDGERWLGLEELGMPVWEAPDGRRWYNRLPVDPKATEWLEDAAARAGRMAAGVFLTVSTVTGSRRRSRELEDRFGAVCENMEGAAAAHVALAHSIPFVEVRGISNRVGPRSRAAWRLEEGARAACEALKGFLVRWKPPQKKGASTRCERSA